MTFKIFGKTVPADAEEFKDFGALNHILERDNISPDELRQAYHDVLLRTLNDAQKTDIHWQIEYLLDEVKVPVNRVLHFLDAKFGSLEDAISHTIGESKLRHLDIVNEIPLADLSYIGRMEAQVMSADGVTVKYTVVMKTPQEETEEQRLEAFKSFITSLEKNLESGDYVEISHFFRLKEEK